MKIDLKFLKQHRNIIIGVCAAAAVLAAAFMYDGAPNGGETVQTEAVVSSAPSSAPSYAPTDEPAEIDSMPTEEADTPVEDAAAEAVETAITEDNRPENTGAGKMSAEEKTQLAAELEAALAPPTAATEPTYAPSAAPVYTEEREGVHYCTISVRCDTILTHMAWLDEAKRVLVPSDGVIYENTAAEFSEGESVFDVLLRELRENNIHFEYENTAVYKSAYIEGIANIYEYDCGELSGWMYSVNGEFPGYASSEYILSDGDVAEIVYTCDLGRDVGAYRTDGAANE